MNKMPIRSRNHVLETISEAYIKQQIPPQWILNKIPIDYGTDYNCEISIDNQVIGTNFSIQLKAKEKDSNKRYVIIKNIKRTSINRWLRRLEPTIVIAYVEELKEAYWIWVEKNTFDLTKNNKTFQLRISKENKVSTIDWSEIYQYVEMIFSKRNLLYEMPKITVGMFEREAWENYFKQEFRLALLGFSELIQSDNENPLLWNSIAICEYQMYNYKKALIAINNALKYRDDDFIRLNKASILTEFGGESKNDKLLKLAIREYEILLSKDKNSALLYNYGNCLRLLEQFEKSKDAYISSLKLNPNNAKAWKNLGSIYFELRNHDVEIDCYDNAIRIDPGLYEALFSKGVTLFRIYGQAIKGLEFMLKGEKLDKRKDFELGFPYVYFWIAEAYLTLNKIEEAIKWNKKGLNIDPSDDYFLKQEERIKLDKVK